jgi:hypothetical protein
VVLLGVGVFGIGLNLMIRSSSTITAPLSRSNHFVDLLYVVVVILMHMMCKRYGEVIDLIFFLGPIYLLNPIFQLLNHLFSTIQVVVFVIVIIVVVINVT